MPLPILTHYQACLDGDNPASWKLRPLHSKATHDHPCITFEIYPDQEEKMVTRQIGEVEWRLKKKPTLADCVRMVSESLGVLAKDVRVYPFDPTKPPPSVLP